MDKIELCKSTKGSQNHRKLQKYSNNFNEIFYFFLKSYRSGILTFCGYNVKVNFDISGPDCKFGFRLYENGDINIHELKSKHSNILKSVIIGKKSFGLWINEWSDGIVEGSFTEDEILKLFIDKNIKIPDSLLLDFHNRIDKKKMKRNKIELERLNKYL